MLLGNLGTQSTFFMTKPWHLAFVLYCVLVGLVKCKVLLFWCDVAWYIFLQVRRWDNSCKGTKLFRRRWGNVTSSGATADRSRSNASKDGSFNSSLSASSHNRLNFAFLSILFFFWQEILETLKYHVGQDLSLISVPNNCCVSWHVHYSPESWRCLLSGFIAVCQAPT